MNFTGRGSDIQGLQAHFLLNLTEGLDSEIDIFLGVAGGNLSADAVLALDLQVYGSG